MKFQHESTKYSEAEMAWAFKSALTSRRGLPGVGPVWKAFEEVQATRGRPDFVAIVRPPEKRLRRQSSSLNMAACSVLESLYSRRALSISTLSLRSGISERAVKAALAVLERAGHATETKRSTFSLAPGAGYESIETWAFELKLRNVKRAVFQAQQYRLFARRVLIVAPPEQFKKYFGHFVTLGRWGIGVATFDPASGDFRIRRRPRRSDPVARGHQVYVLSRMVNGE